MKDLKDSLYTAIKSCTNLVVYESQAPIGAIMPYVTYSLPVTTSIYDSYESMVKVDIWDNKINTETLEIESQAIFQGLKMYTNVSEKVGITIYSNIISDLPDPEVEIHHKQINLDVISYIR